MGRIAFYRPTSDASARLADAMTSLRDVTLQCPICGTWFLSRAVADAGPAAGTRTDFHPRAAGVQTLAYMVHLCAACGFAGPEDDFASDEISAASAAATAGDGAPMATCESVLGSAKYEMAAAVAERRGAGPRAVGDLLLRAAWCCVDEDDAEAERYFRRLAARSYERTLDGYDEVEPADRAVVAYLVGELWRRVGDVPRARAWLDRVADEAVDPAAQRWLLALAMQQRERPREWLG